MIISGRGFVAVQDNIDWRTDRRYNPSGGESSVHARSKSVCFIEHNAAKIMDRGGAP